MQYILVKPESYDTRWGNTSSTVKSFEKAKQWLAPLSDVNGKFFNDVQQTQLTFGRDDKGQYTAMAANGRIWFLHAARVNENEGDTTTCWDRLTHGNTDGLYADIYDQLYIHLSNEYWCDGRPDGPKGTEGKVVLRFQSTAPNFVSGPGRVACQLEQLLSRLEKLD